MYSSRYPQSKITNCTLPPNCTEVGTAVSPVGPGIGAIHHPCTLLVDERRAAEIEKTETCP